MLIYDGLHYDALALEADGLLEAVRTNFCLAKGRAAAWYGITRLMDDQVRFAGTIARGQTGNGCDFVRSRQHCGSGGSGGLGSGGSGRTSIY